LRSLFRSSFLALSVFLGWKALFAREWLREQRSITRLIGGVIALLLLLLLVLSLASKAAAAGVPASLYWPRTRLSAHAARSATPKTNAKTTNSESVALLTTKATRTATGNISHAPHRRRKGVIS